MDLNGVLMRDEENAVPGAEEFLAALRSAGIPFLVFTNESVHTPRDMRARLLERGLDVPEHTIWTSALATARFLREQRPGGSAYVLGEAGLSAALLDAGYVLTGDDPDYVVLGETRTYSFEAITHAIRLIEGGARFIATNPDEKGPGAEGPLPATGAVAALVQRVTEHEPYYIGKPNPLMMRSALRAVGARSANAIVLGDRMDTDVRCGIEAGMRTILVLSGLSGPDAVAGHPYQPTAIVDSVADIIEHVRDPFGSGPA
ncbi:MAG: HAD family hydrolase [Saccharopolyspora sp.]|uniref:HAD-IIA family hydrolase n=1 Tax=Saccharopolyspora sp. TaxID=33915 RepID=UPI0025D2B20A|nr:HAD-IIA family hydrolase [Saccharopolyspora sp.]MBQ6640304.1 HAD family hydrolase [Saccharopolyspora sp.]